MQRILIVELLLLLLCGAALAEGALGDFEALPQADGSVQYVFDEVTVAVPASWAEAVAVLPQGDRALFCHEPSRSRWQQELGYEDGGLLMALRLLPDGGGADDPGCDVLGATGRGVYALSWPTDSQAYKDDAVMAEYDALSQEADYVKAHALLHAPDAVGPDGVIAFDEGAAAYSGAWVPFEDGFALYLPAQWRALELSDAQREAGLFYRAGNDGGEGPAGDAPMGVAVSWIPAGELKTLSDLENDFGTAGFTGIGRRFVNGLWTVDFTGPEDGYRGAAFFHPTYPDYVLTVYVAPLGAQGSTEAAVGRAILDSLKPMPME